MLVHQRDHGFLLGGELSSLAELCGGLPAIAPGPTQVISVPVMQAVGSWWLAHLLLSFPQLGNLLCAPHKSVSLQIVPAPKLLFLAVLGAHIINTSGASHSLEEGI